METQKNGLCWGHSFGVKFDFKADFSGFETCAEGGT